MAKEGGDRHMTHATASGGAGAHPEPNYMGVFIALAVLTVFEIGVIFLPVPKLAIGAMLVILLFWLTMLYMSFGLFSPHNGTVVAAMLVGALSLATAMFLIVEMNHPMRNATIARRTTFITSRKRVCA